jgi:uncharacterized membrane protein YqaE (UPF0057 family)
MKPVTSMKPGSLHHSLYPLPLYVLAAHQAFITSREHQTTALVLYFLAPALGLLTSTLFPMARLQGSTVESLEILENLWAIDGLLIPVTVMLAVGFLDSVVGVAVLAVFLAYAGNLFRWLPELLVLAFLVPSLVAYEQSGVVEDTVLIDSRYNYETGWISINTLCLFAMGLTRNKDPLKDSLKHEGLVSLLLLGFTLAVSRAWVQDAGSRVPLFTTWFATDRYERFWERLPLSLGLVAALPVYKRLEVFVVSFSVSAAVGVSTVLLGGASLLLLLSATLRISLVLAGLYIRN